jgi:hypothetical protein
MRVHTMPEGKNIVPTRSWTVHAGEEIFALLGLRRDKHRETIQDFNAEGSMRALDGFSGSHTAFAELAGSEAEKYGLRPGIYELEISVEAVRALLSKTKP